MEVICSLGAYIPTVKIRSLLARAADAEKNVQSHNDFPAPISVAVTLRRVWYRSAAPIVASRVALVLSPKSRRFIYVAAYAENLESVSRDAKTATTIRQDDRSFARSYQDSSRAGQLLRTPGEILCVRRWGFDCSWILALRASFFMLKSRVAQVMHLLQVYDAAQLRGYPRIVRVPMCIFGLFSSVGQDGKGGSKCPSRMYHISGPGTHAT